MVQSEISGMSVLWISLKSISTSLIIVFILLKENCILDKSIVCRI